jgi:sugar phosphate isomerase/epimerase
MIFGLQLFTVREFLNPLPKLKDTLKNIRETGYDSVELFGLLETPGKEWLKLLEDSNLGVCGAHFLWEEIQENIDYLIENLKEMRCENLVIALSKNVDFNDYEEVLYFADALNAAAEKCKSENINLVYHNHNHEFIPIRDKKTGMDILLEKTENLKFELDIYQTQLGGIYVPEFCKKLSGRLELLHIKDFCPGDLMTPDFPMRHPACTHLGGGNFDLPLFFQAAISAGCDRFIVEQDGNWIGGNPFEALKYSFEYLKRWNEEEGYV